MSATVRASGWETYCERCQGRYGDVHPTEAVATTFAEAHPLCSDCDERPMSQEGRLRAVMAEHDSGPEYALVECIGDEFTCPATERVDCSSPMTDDEVVALLAARGWSVRPTLCPKHASGGRAPSAVLS